MLDSLNGVRNLMQRRLSRAYRRIDNRLSDTHNYFYMITVFSDVNSEMHHRKLEAYVSLLNLRKVWERKSIKKQSQEP